MSASIRLETIDGPGLSALRDFTFNTKSSIPIDDQPIFKVRGLRTEQKQTMSWDKGSKTFAENGTGSCLIRLHNMLELKPHNRVEEIWSFLARGNIIGGDGEVYEAWLSKEFEDQRKSQERYGCSNFLWNDYSTKTRKGLLWEIR